MARGRRARRGLLQVAAADRGSRLWTTHEQSATAKCRTLTNFRRLSLSRRPCRRRVASPALVFVPRYHARRRSAACVTCCATARHPGGHYRPPRSSLSCRCPTAFRHPSHPPQPPPSRRWSRSSPSGRSRTSRSGGRTGSTTQTRSRAPTATCARGRRSASASARARTSRAASVARSSARSASPASGGTGPLPRRTRSGRARTAAGSVRPGRASASSMRGSTDAVSRFVFAEPARMGRGRSRRRWRRQGCSRLCPYRRLG